MIELLVIIGAVWGVLLLAGGPPQIPDRDEWRARDEWRRDLEALGRVHRRSPR